MAYKNRKKQKQHIESLQNVGWRGDNKKLKRYRELMASLPHSLSTREKEELLKSRNQL